MILRLRFSGICHFVPNRNPEQDCKVCVVIPDLRKGGFLGKFPVAIDDEIEGDRPTPHRAFCSVLARHVVGMTATAARHDSVLVRYLVAERVSFEVLKQDGGEAPSLRGIMAALTSLPDLKEVASAFETIDEEIVKEAPGDRVLAQVLLTGGRAPNEAEKKELKGDVNFDSFNIEPTLKKDSGQMQALQILNPIHLYLPRGAAARIWIRPFKTGIGEAIELQGEKDEVVEVRISNLCDIDPLAWRYQGRSRQDDVDFKWYFQLLPKKTREAIVSKLIDKKSQLPFPKVPDQSGGGGGIDCGGSTGGEREFNFSKIVGE